MPELKDQRKSLLSSQARVQAPWIKVTIGNFTFGVFDKKTRARSKDDQGFYLSYNVQYPSYVQRLSIIKVNGQVNQYTLSIVYPIRPGDDPNFFDKVFSSVSNTRKIVFTYGDAAMPSYIYKDEEAIITGVTQQFDLEGSSIAYTVKAISGAALGKTGSFTFVNSGKKKPSDEIKRVFRNSRYGLKDIFTGMNNKNINTLVAGDDKAIELDTKVNISPIDYISYLAGCMIPSGSVQNNISKDIYVLTIHDDTIYDKLYSDTTVLGGPYFKVTRTSYSTNQSDAYQIDIGYNTATIVRSFSIKQDENYSILYDYSNKLYPEQYVQRLNNKGQWEQEFAPASTSGNGYRKTRAEDISWFTKMTKYPISATVKIQGLLRPATLMQYVRLNVIFPGGGVHTSSGLYIVTQQQDDIGGDGYTTTLTMTRINS